jgi:hypothetical protein
MFRHPARSSTPRAPIFVVPPSSTATGAVGRPGTVGRPPGVVVRPGATMARGQVGAWGDGVECGDGYHNNIYGDCVPDAPGGGDYLICDDGYQRDFDTGQCVPIPGGGTSGKGPCIQGNACQAGGDTGTWDIQDGVCVCVLQGQAQGGCVPGKFCPEPGNPYGPQSVYDENCNCAKLCGAGLVYDSLADGCVKPGTGTPGSGGGITDQSCVDAYGAGFSACNGDCYFCGPNTVINPADCGCNCVAGFVPDPSGAEGSGCVPAPVDGGGGGGPGPDGGGGEGPPPVTGGGGNAAGGGSEDSNVGAIVLGVLAIAGLGYGAYKISKKRLGARGKRT